MNKAFVKEPDPTAGGRCPRCGSAGQAVGSVTLDAHLEPTARRNLAEVAYFCPFARCEVAYFDAFDRVALVESLVRPVYPKSLEAPLCGCFGLSIDDIEQDVLEGAPLRCRELLAKSKGPDARCSSKSANGQCCVAEMQRYYMKFRERHASGKQE